MLVELKVYLRPRIFLKNKETGFINFKITFSVLDFSRLIRGNQNDI